MVKTSEEIRELLGSFVGKECWRIGVTRITGSSFSLQAGQKVRKPYVSSFGPQGAERELRGELSLLVWCTWRLDGANAPLASSDQSTEVIANGLETLVGETIQAMELFEPGLDLQVQFSRDLRLWIFCDHLPGNPSFDGNWQIRVGEKCLGAGPGHTWTAE